MDRKILAAVVIGFALLAVCAGSVVAILPAINAVREGDVHFSFFSASNVSADSIEEQKFPVSGPADLSVNSPYGKVVVAAKVGIQEITISSHKYAWGINKQDAEALLEQAKIIVTQNGDRIDVRVEKPIEVDFFHIGPAGVQVDFTITVPPDCAVDASTSSGDVSVEGTNGKATLRSNFGAVWAKGIQGGLSAHSDSGKVVAENVGISGDSVEASSSFGDVLIQNATAKSLKGRSNSGSVTLNDSTVEGLVEMETDFGEVRLDSVQAGSVDATTNSGKVTLERVTAQGDVIVKSDFGEISVISTIAERYDLHANSGKIQAEGVQGNVKAHSDFGDLVLSGEKVVLDASTNSGSVTFSGTLGGGISVLESDFGDITVNLPEGSEFNMDLKTDFGSVQSDFPPTTNQAESSRLVGKVGAGGPTLKVSTNNGNIKVNMLLESPDGATPVPATETPVE